MRLAASCAKTRATKAPGSTPGEVPAEGCVDAGGVWRILDEDALCEGVSHHCEGGSVTGRSASHTFGDLRS